MSCVLQNNYNVNDSVTNLSWKITAWSIIRRLFWVCTLPGAEGDAMCLKGNSVQWNNPLLLVSNLIAIKKHKVQSVMLQMTYQNYFNFQVCQRMVNEMTMFLECVITFLEKGMSELTDSFILLRSRLTTLPKLFVFPFTFMRSCRYFS